MVIIMRAVIISGGNITDYGYIKEQIKAFGGDLIIAADSGYHHAVQMELKPDLVVGDFDSLGELEQADIETVQYSAEKNFTDTELALEHARRMNADEFLLAAVTGTRLDHTLTNIFMLKTCLEHGENAEIIDEHNRIRLTETRLSLTEGQYRFVSLVPLSDCSGVCTRGMKYPLENAELKFGSGLGVSNELPGEWAEVSLEKGLLLVIESRD
ncbi:MAG: thiamine diphosphokinase [Oscillospiraceae bacterium]|nr:thiamine diphosphokinase [Oscillospiraceae bacterium]